MSGVQSTKGHLAGNGGLRGHSVNEAFPFVVVAQGNPHEPDGLRWRVRKPDGHYLYTVFESAEQAGKWALGLSRGHLDVMSELEFARAGGYYYSPHLFKSCLDKAVIEQGLPKGIISGPLTPIKSIKGGPSRGYLI